MFKVLPFYKILKWRFRYQMKHFNFRKLLSMLAIIIIIQNGAVVVYNTTDDTGSYTEENGAAPCSDRPVPDDNHS